MLFVSSTFGVVFAHLLVYEVFTYLLLYGVRVWMYAMSLSRINSLGTTYGACMYLSMEKRQYCSSTMDFIIRTVRLLGRKNGQQDGKQYTNSSTAAVLLSA